MSRSDAGFASELWRERAVLCDLLCGRTLRLAAEERLDVALFTEQVGMPEAWVDDELARAVQYERIAAQAEQGLVFWGANFNRAGWEPALVRFRLAASEGS